MNQSEIEVICCFCGEELSFASSIQLSIISDKLEKEAQTVYCHKQCLDRVLHKDIPRYFDVQSELE
jgi:hypothetical protein